MWIYTHSKRLHNNNNNDNDDDDDTTSALEVVTGGDLLTLLRRMLDLGGRDTVRITKVKGHADEGMVLDGRVREVDRLG